MTKLSVNVNAVAYLRNRRDVPWPDLVQIARAILDAGAHGITVHPRPDQRHIRFGDVADLAAMLRSEYPTAEFNIEGYPTDHFLSLVQAAAPQQVTLVPDLPGQSTSDHGWDFAADGAMLRDCIAGLRQGGARVSVFVDPDPAAPAGARDVGADRIEIYTGPYGGALESAAHKRELARVAETAAAAAAAGIGVNAGHDLTLQNLPPLIAAAPNIAEVSIGHGITADALLVGFPEAVRRYLAVLGSGPGTAKAARG